MRWAVRSHEHYYRAAANGAAPPGELFAIVQGGMHLNLRSDSHDIGDSNPGATFGYVATELDRRAVSFIVARESLDEPRIAPIVRKAFKGVLVLNNGLDRETGEEVIRNGEADAVAYGRLFIANPDLPLRFAENAPLNAPDGSTFYKGGSHGYTDYPFHTQQKLAG